MCSIRFKGMDVRHTRPIHKYRYTGIGNGKPNRKDTIAGRESKKAVHGFP
jgi:hypothetical protein